jgi:hypothetical protein
MTGATEEKVKIVARESHEVSVTESLQRPPFIQHIVFQHFFALKFCAMVQLDGTA